MKRRKFYGSTSNMQCALLKAEFDPVLKPRRLRISNFPARNSATTAATAHPELYDDYAGDYRGGEVIAQRYRDIAGDIIASRIR
jgi:hypothetical protein